MKKIVIAPDSFKGTLTAARICEIVRSSVLRHFPECEAVAIPLADGGEGTADCLTAFLGGRTVTAECKGPFMSDMSASYGVVGDTAVVEFAAACGLPLAGDSKNPEKATTYGVGQLIMHAVRGGAKRILLGLGGSCTNDFGCGMAAACGVRFLDADGREFVPTGGTLRDVASIDISQKSALLENVSFTAMCDITNPTCGENGAAYVFAPQKGADGAMVERLDSGLRRICEVIKKDFGADYARLSGGGAAGGAGAGAAFFLGASLESGAEAVLKAARFENALEGADLVITGEGRLDRQSFSGKAVSCVCRAAGKRGVPVIAITGGTECSEKEAREMGLTAVFTINRLPRPLEISAPNSDTNLSDTADSIMSLLSL